MLTVLSATSYCALTYAAGYYFFKVKEPGVLSVGAWLISPITVPVTLVAVSVFK